MSLKTRISNFLERVYVGDPPKDTWYFLLLASLEKFDEEARAEERRKSRSAFQEIQSKVENTRWVNPQRAARIADICREAIAPREK